MVMIDVTRLRLPAEIRESGGANPLKRDSRRRLEISRLVPRVELGRWRQTHRKPHSKIWSLRRCSGSRCFLQHRSRLLPRVGFTFVLRSNGNGNKRGRNGGRVALGFMASAEWDGANHGKWRDERVAMSFAKRGGAALSSAGDLLQPCRDNA